MCVYHFQILGDLTENVNKGKVKSLETFHQRIIRLWSQQLRGTSEQPVINDCPSKNSATLLKENDQFSVGGVATICRNDKIIRCLELAHTFICSLRNV